MPNNETARLAVLIAFTALRCYRQHPDPLELPFTKCCSQLGALRRTSQGLHARLKRRSIGQQP